MPDGMPYRIKAMGKDRRMFCTKCGTEVKDGAVFCTKCGARIKEIPGAGQAQAGAAGPAVKAADEKAAANGRTDAQKVPDRPEHRGRGKLPLILGAAAVVLIAGAAAFFFGKKQADQQPDPGTWEWEAEFDEETGGGEAGESTEAAQEASSKDASGTQAVSGQEADSVSFAPDGTETAALADGTPQSGLESPDMAAFPPVGMDCVRSVSASSVLTEQSGAVHAAAQIMDQKLDRAWVEGAAGQGIGESVSFYLDGEYTISGFTIHAGYQKSQDLYYKNSRPASVRIEFDGGNFLRFTLDDVCAAQTIAFDTPQTASTVTLYIESVYAGEKYEDTVISELAFY